MAASDERGVKRFSGDGDDPGKQLRRWRAWAEAKMMTMKDLSNKQRGPWIYTLLDGKAWDAVEHLTLEDLTQEDGDETVWKVLSTRFPEREPHDLMGEALGEVFGLAATEGETIQQWTARVQEVFEKCKRRANVTFPDEAQGWIALNCSGMNDEQKAIVKAKAQGDLAITAVTSAMRSCFPGYKASSKGRKPLSAMIVDPDGNQETNEDLDQFEDVEAFLTDHPGIGAHHQDEDIPEEEAAEALAVSWRERRREITKLQQSRRFGAAQGARKEFRVEIEELKKRTRCRKCNRLGHWARECRSTTSARTSQPSSSSTKTTFSSAPMEAHAVEHEVSLAEVTLDEGNELQHDVEDFSDIHFVGTAEVLQASSTGLVSSPGYGVIDSGCGRTLIGKETLRKFEKKLAFHTKKMPEEYAATNVFRFGNGATEVSQTAVQLPVSIAKKTGLIDAAVIEGQAPLLLGRPTLEKLDVQLNFGNRTMSFMKEQHQVNMLTNTAGQVLIDLLDFPVPDKDKAACDCCSVQQPVLQQSPPEPRAVDPVVPNPIAARPNSQHESQHSACASKQRSVLCQETLSASQPKTRPLKAKQQRRISKQAKHAACSQESHIAVAELFSPPRFAAQARTQGATGIAFDISQGCDLLDPSTSQEVSDLLDNACPHLLVACPPCIHWGGWDHLNRCYRTALEQARLIRIARRQVRYCVQQIERQLSRGGQFLFEHPLHSAVWRFPAMQALVRKYHFYKIDMCAYGLTCPKTQLPMRKPTGLLCSDPKLSQAMRRCPGCAQHQVIQGTISSKRNRSAHAAEYTPEFVRSVWQAIGPQGYEGCTVQGEPLDWTALGCECLASSARRDEDPPEGQAPQIDGLDGLAPEVGRPEPPRQPQNHPEPESPEPRDRNQAVDAALKKLHCNLGHPSQRELLRVLRHSGASDLAIARASLFQCSVCANQQRPSPPLPANTHVVLEFNEKLGIDVKYLPSWLPNKRVPFVNMVDLATSLQVVAPLSKVETGETIREALRDRWLAWAGPPQKLLLDPSQPHLGSALGDFCNSQGIDMQHTAAEAHFQNGKVERHGQWLERIVTKVLDEIRPQNEEEYLACIVQAQSAKNSLLAEAGVSPYQLVFGRNPRVPTDLLQDHPHVPAVDALDSEPGMARAQAIRHAARKAFLECQDDRALRAALRARPRAHRPFQSGDWVYYWRTQKSVGGQRFDGGRWYGAGIVLGAIGRNLVVAHRRSVLRCAPEQLRMATPAEATAAEFPQNELLGIRNLLEKGQFPKSQFQDLTQEGQPPDQAEIILESTPPALNAAQCLQQARAHEASVETPRAEPHRPDRAPNVAVSGLPSPTPSPAPADTYGPVRRVSGKSRPEPLFRLPDSQPDDFLELMGEMVPHMLRELPVSGTERSTVTSPRGESSKREASQEPEDGPSGPRPRILSQEALFCEATLLSQEHLHNSHVEQLMAAFLQKRAQKELPAQNNPPELQQRIDEAKTIEWDTVSGKGAVRVWTGAKADAIRDQFSHRFIGSRFVVTNKRDEEGERIKARLCLQGHNDPDFYSKIMSGECHSPTLSPLARAVLLQLLVSRKWTLNLGDIKGAFMEAGPIPDKYRPLYAHQPPGGIPGLDPHAVLEITGTLYGANDAPAQWYREFDAQARAAGFIRSAFDSCLYYFGAPNAHSVDVVSGVLGAHVDDTITGGEGEAYEQAIAKLRARFPYRKWRVGSGEFCGVTYQQDPKSMEITYHQKEYAQLLRPISLTKERQRQKDEPATEREVAALRAVNGAANWLASQTRPDLAVQTSFSQQSFPEVKVKHLLYANQLVHRARQYSDVSITVKHIPWEDLALVFHSDAGFGNATGNKTQAGYMLAFTDKHLEADQQAAWSPFLWKSYKMSRVVASTLAGETQSFATASGVAEWVSLMIAEINKGPFDLRTCEDHLRDIAVTGVTDCKSLYDAIHSTTSPSKMDDKRVAIDVAIIRQCISRTNLSTRWCPSELQLADSLTKDAADPADLLRAALSHGVYQLSEEAEVLRHKKEQRDRRASRSSLFAQTPKVVCETFRDQDAQATRTPPERKNSVPVRRISVNQQTGQVLENTDLSRGVPPAKQFPKLIPCLLTEIWYQVC